MGDNSGSRYIPLELPCGKRINQDGLFRQYCANICLDKSFKEIDECYAQHKKGRAMQYGR